MPDYRELEPLCELIEQARSHQEGERPLLVAVDGRSGSGKTTLAGDLAACLRGRGMVTEVFHLEDLYQGWSGLAQAALVWQRLAEAVVSGRASSPGAAPRWFGWDWASSQATGPHPFTAAQQAAGGVLIAEGVGALTGAHDVGVFVELDTVRRRQRALARDGETYRPYWDMWAEQEADLLAAYASAYEGAGVRYLQR
ncbi:MAG: hypothetical protein Q4A03_06205 [Rothia sp. (in: high G+C Gram-positive bacteria)]|uniref:hypothetical protein n=1 Tax=Rothia sp. (in: high G+C Gram-positive bacteria) TaxID=1885016 RepID=UPI002707102C|nr:hypothetical protein [Rothia sp. (in: high G+C Gram-positive bacteria)]